MPMKPEVQRITELNPGEPCYILLGGVPFPAQTIAAADLPRWVEMLVLLEDVGDPDTITSDTATTYFSAGTNFPARWTGDRHDTDARRLFKPASPFTGEVHGHA